ncbi:MAG: DUF3470 domain-containing protein [Burkholderiales bacterium]
MTFVVIESCIKCKQTHCVDMCSTDAIFAGDDAPLDQHAVTPLNVELAKIWKPIIAMKPALPDADEWAKIRDKFRFLTR